MQASHFIEVDWRAASAAGANDGSLTLWVDGVQQAELTGIDNDTWRVDRAKLGANMSIDATTSGTYYFESRRSSYIGPLAHAPSVARRTKVAALAPVQGNELILRQAQDIAFTPIDDAYIHNGSPNNNYGSATTLQVDNSPVKHFLIKFDVTGVNGQTISSARIRLYNVDAASKGGDFYQVLDNSWQEETVTWNNAPAAETTLLASLGAVSINAWYEVDVTSLITGDGTYSLRISDSVGGADYSSKEGANPPQLVITFGGTPAPTNTPTPTPTLTPTPVTSTPTVPSPAIFSNGTFTYDGDRVKSVITTNIAGAQRIAMRMNGTLNFIISDHLGSTSLVTDANGVVVLERRFTILRDKIIRTEENQPNDTKHLFLCTITP